MEENLVENSSTSTDAQESNSTIPSSEEGKMSVVETEFDVESKAGWLFYPGIVIQ